MKFLSDLSLRKSKGIVRYVAFFFTSSVLISLISAFYAEPFRFDRLWYVVLFLNISAAPLFFINKQRGSYLIMAVFLPLYFLLFCIGDLVSVLGIESKATIETPGVESKVDLIIIVGGIVYTLGYLLTVNIGKRYWRGWLYYEWDSKKTKIAAIVCWLIGTWAFIIVFFFSENSSLPLSIVSNLKHFSQLGSLMLIYLYLTRREKSTLVILAVICIFELALGFVANTKEMSFSTVLLFLILGFISKGRINKTLLAAVVATLVVYNFFFGAYRLWVIQVPNQTPLQALQHFSASFKTVIDNAGRKDPDNPHTISFLKERIETRKYLVILVDGIDNKGIRTMDGYTLGLFFDSFIPRIFWPDKPEISIGRLFNHEFRISLSPKTYIPATHIGEFYWNYKMPGVVIGMFFVGVIMAFIAKMSDLSRLITLPRVLVLLMTIYMICVRFEQDWAQQYSNVVRALGSIFILNLMLRQKYGRYRKVQRSHMITAPEHA